MLEQITWKDYLIMLMSALSAYYIIVAALCYRKEISGMISKQRKDFQLTAELEGDEAMAFDELERVVSGIKRDILERAGLMTGKGELLDQLSEKLADYDGLRRPAFRDAINHYIVEHAKEICGVVFSEEELNEAWRMLPR